MVSGKKNKGACRNKLLGGKMKKRKKIRKAILRAKRKGWNDCYAVMKEEIETQKNRQKYIDSLTIIALENEIKRIMGENRELKREYTKFISLKNDLVYQSGKLGEATENLGKDLMATVQRFLKIADNCERVDRVFSKKEQKIKNLIK